MHVFIIGKSYCIGIIHLGNQTPVEWFSKHHKIDERARCGSEFVAACIIITEVSDLCYTLQMMGIPLGGKAFMFGDNQSVITSGNFSFFLEQASQCHLGIPSCL
jgi:hypothetical protein